jgi:NAD(P)-dependent dehydrogenase (short-subunit alcohol dehydrogenase family)
MLLAKELGSFGIRVVSVAPGFIETQSTKDNLHTSILDAIIKKIPLKKLGTAGDIAHTVLAVAHSQYISGTIIDVNGGLVL